MKTRNLTIYIFAFAAVLSMTIGTVKGESENQIQPGQSEQVEKYISQQRQRIENFYLAKLIELQLNAQKQIELLEIADKAVYSSLAAQAQLAKDVLYIHEHGYSVDAKAGVYIHRPYRHEIDSAARQFAVNQSRITERKNRISAALEWETKRLEIQKRYALTIELTQLENRLKQNLTRHEPEPTHGIVTGIVYCREKPLALIDGKIMHEGQIIHDVKVIKINTDTVEFEKNDKQWQQKVQQKVEFWQ